MSVITVNTDDVFSVTNSMRAAVERLQQETVTLRGHFTMLQNTWTGGASAAFQSANEQWQAAQSQVEQALAAITQALDQAGQQYVQAEQYSAALFR
ncbi:MULTISPECIES: WXG100 family type VII secretion target [Microbacterium]|uniref:ESAT-6-like protein n=1 Tax=Microbacterium resistens TaxID=156977 RepID=A0ABY3RRA8_9MICO|nr:WXG100 family type VII secretion target [Microbacterium resistens]MBW1638156.1 WXG100 family type VII secretion target [Microbacterium resistens]UGS26653.1 WXG100 family type VII secretion target [Microbacterium resistens]